MKPNADFSSFFWGALLTFLGLSFTANSQDYSCGVFVKPNPDTSVLADWQLPFSDRFGNRYLPVELTVPDLSGSGPEEFPGCGCTDVGVDTGPFDLWFEDCFFNTGEGFNHLTEGPVRRFEVCRVFAELLDIIQFQDYPCGGNNLIIQIRIMPSVEVTGYYPDGADLPQMLPAILGQGSSYYGADHEGILDGMVWEIINSGLVSQEYSGFFHGVMRFNLDPLIGIPWHASFNPADLPPANQWDLYSVAYHEVFHVLGFHSFLINTTNGNFTGPNTSGFSRYDRFLTAEPGNISIIQNNNPPGFDWSLNPGINPTDLYNSCDDPGTGPDVCFTTGVNCYPVFTGNVGSTNAFSHLNINCDGSPTPQYLMNPDLPNGVRRTPKPDEWEIMCALGYTVDDGTTSCGCNLAAADNWGPGCLDGFAIPYCQCIEFTKADLLGNDSPNATDLVIKVNDPFIGELIQNGNIFTYCPNRPGLHALKYFPLGCAGQEGNTAFVFIEAIADPYACPELLECDLVLPSCDDLMGYGYCHQSDLCQEPGTGCELFCNGMPCGTAYSNNTFPVGILDYPFFPVPNNVSPANAKAVVPNWYRSHGSPDYYVNSHSINIAGGGGANNNPENAFSEGVFSMFDFSVENYLLGFSINPTSINPSLLQISAIQAEKLEPAAWEQSNVIAGYTGIGPLEAVNLEVHQNLTFTKAGACIEIIDDSYNSLWFLIDPLYSAQKGGVWISNVEMIVDDFSAGEDVMSPICGTPVILGMPFCMLEGLEMTYTWSANGIPIAQYTVLDGVVNVIFGDINPLDQTLTVYPEESTTYLLSREISDYGEYSADQFELCALEDEVFVEVLIGPPTADFSFQADDCETIVQFNAVTDTDPNAIYLWDFGDGQTSGLQNLQHQFLDYGTFVVSLKVVNSCGEDTYEQEVSLAPCEQDCNCEGQLFGTFTGTTIFSETLLPNFVVNGVLDLGATGCLAIDGTFIIDDNVEFAGGEIFMSPGAVIQVENPNTFRLSNIFVHGCSELWHTIHVEPGAKLWTKGARIEDGLYAITAYNKSELWIAHTDFNRNFLGVFLTSGAYLRFNSEFVGNSFDCTAPLLPSFTSTHLILFGNELPPIDNWAYTGMWVRGSSQLLSLGSIYETPANLNEFRHLANGVIANQFNLMRFRHTRFWDMKKNSPYPQNGFGIQARGNGSSSIILKGLGLDLNPQPPLALTGSALPTFEKAGTGIFTFGVNLNIFDSKIIDCTKGIDAIPIGLESIFIGNNQIASRQNGILCGGPDIFWENALFDNFIETGYQGVGTSRRGIDCPGGMDMNLSTPSISENRVFIINNGEPTSKFTGIRIGAVADFSVDQNEVYLLNATPFSADFEGIFVDQCNDIQVTCNEVRGQAYEVSDPFSGVGMRVLNTQAMDQEVLYSCNTFDMTMEGTLFESFCRGTVLNTNHFNDHKIALHLNETAVFSDLTFPVIQDHHGNRWEKNPYLESGAVHEATDPLLVANSRFEVHTDDPTSGFWPDPIELPNLDCVNLPPGSCDWFNLDAFGTPLACDPGTDCPGGLAGFSEGGLGELALAEKVASSQFFSTQYPNGALWAAQQGLYREVSKNPQALGLSAVIDSFFLAASNGEIGLLESVRQEIPNLYQPGNELEAKWLLEKETRTFFLDSLMLIDQELETATGPDSIWLFGQRVRLGDSLSTIGQRLSEVLDDIAAERAQTAQTLWTQNDAIAAGTLQGSNEKLINALFLSTLAQGIDTFSQAQVWQIESVAFQCIYEGGQAVTRARNLYRLVKDTSFIDKDLCQVSGGGPSSPSAKVNETRNTEKTRLLGVSPNPAGDRLLVENPLASSATLTIYNNLGRIVKAQQIAGGSYWIEVDVSAFSPGLYWLEIHQDRKTLGNARIVVY